MALADGQMVDTVLLRRVIALQAVCRHFDLQRLEDAKPRVSELRILLQVLATARWPE